MPSILIVGGGIGGLTTAIALRRLGIAVDVVEQSPVLSVVGSGITIQINGAAIFDALQIVLPPDDVSSIGLFEMVNHKGRVLMSGDVEKLDLGYPSLNVHRADLQRALLSTFEAAGGRLQLGRRVVGLTQQGGADGAEPGVRVDFADGSSGEWGLVIGADGMHSAVRAALYGSDPSTLRYSGQTCWRFAVDLPDGIPELTVERWTPGRRIGLVPLSRERIYVYMVESAPEGTPGPGTATVATLRSKFAPIDDRLGPILDQLDARAEAGSPVAIHHGDLCEQARVSYGEGRVLLLGDAAHAMTPNMGQGAGTAIEDAAALMAILATHPERIGELPAALEARQWARVRQIQKTSWQMGAMAHASSSVVRSLRDLMLPLMPEWMSLSQVKKLYGPGLELAAELREILS